MLFDGHGREYLFSVTQEMLLKTLTAVCLRENALLANSPSRGPSLRHLLECVRKATRELRIDTGRTDDDTEGWQSPASSVTGVPLEVGDVVNDMSNNLSNEWARRRRWKE